MRFAPRAIQSRFSPFVTLGSGNPAALAAVVHLAKEVTTVTLGTGGIAHQLKPQGLTNQLGKWQGKPGLKANRRNYAFGVQSRTIMIFALAPRAQRDRESGSQAYVADRAPALAPGPKTLDGHIRNNPVLKELTKHVHI